MYPCLETTKSDGNCALSVGKKHKDLRKKKLPSSALHDSSFCSPRNLFVGDDVVVTSPKSACCDQRNGNVTTEQQYVTDKFRNPRAPSVKRTVTQVKHNATPHPHPL